jgi:ABC-2 type transport system permease protein
MTTATLTRPGAIEGTARPRRLGFSRVLSAEWTKLRTVRSTAWTLASLVVVSIGLTALVNMLAAPDLAESMADGEAFEPVGAFVMWGGQFGQIAAFVLGVLVASSEYASGMIRATLAAAPKRWHVLGAKSIVLAGVLAVLGTLASLGMYLAANFFLDQEGIGLALSDDGVLRAIFGGGLYLAVLALFGLALGLLMRHTAAAVTVGLAMLFVVGNLVMLIPGALGEWLTKLMPGNAGSTVAMVESFNPDLLDPWAGFAVFAGETLLLLALAGWLFSRRDA